MGASTIGYLVLAIFAVIFIVIIVRNITLWYFRIDDAIARMDQMNEHLAAIRAALTSQQGQ